MGESKKANAGEAPMKPLVSRRQPHGCDEEVRCLINSNLKSVKIYIDFAAEHSKNQVAIGRRKDGDGKIRRYGQIC